MRIVLLYWLILLTVNNVNDKNFKIRLNDNIKTIEEIFCGDSILRKREFSFGGVKGCLFYFDGMVNVELINESIIKPLVRTKAQIPKDSPAKFAGERLLFASELKMTSLIDDAVKAMLYGDTLLLLENSHIAVVINTKGWRTRGISEPENERVLQGPREGFDEAAMFNVAMLRRRLQTSDFCASVLRLGRRTNTYVFICFLKSLVNEDTLRILKHRLSKIDIDSVLDSNYITEQISDNKSSLFKSVGTTERPDIVAARLLEGRIALVVDATPVVITLPYLFSENFQSDEDYYINYKIASAGRLLRFLSFVLAVSVSALYLALTTFHFDFLPPAFAMAVQTARQGVPFPSFLECVILTFIFEILRETGQRMPQNVGHALSIVGGLVVGQAAVEAKIVSAPMLIAVALSGICGLMIPRLKTAVFYLRFGMILSAAMGGIFGMLILGSITLISVLKMESFGVDSTLSLQNPTLQKLKDTLIRAPWTRMFKRPLIQTKNVLRKRK